ncbi:MAG: glycosyltransferase family 2 protein [Mariprofundaceae bacterium]|nr:glycosyltransferase family 2 protein [Mariprofundaceae bacterium]
MTKISAYIPVLNEEDKIEDALKSITWVDEIIILDTGCTDNTINIAKKYTSNIIPYTFKGFGKLRNAGIDACSNEWVLSIDADERCTQELALEIKQLLTHKKKHVAYWIPRKNWLMGRWVKHSGWYPDYCQPKLFLKHALRYRDDDLVHEGWDAQGSIGYLKGDVLHFSFQHLSDIIRKIDNYSELGAEKLESNGVSGGLLKAVFRGSWAFLRIYILKLGFLDGKAGFIIALTNFEGTFYRYAKLTWKKNDWDVPPKV